MLFVSSLRSLAQRVGLAAMGAPSTGCFFGLAGYAVWVEHCLGARGEQEGDEDC
jgi:hypothetical protein